MTMQRQLWRWVCGVVILAAIDLGAQEPQQPRPTFRGGVALITVDVSVVDGTNHPVRDLNAGDFTVTVDGAARRVATIQFVEQQTTAEEPVSVARALAAPPAYGSNEGMGTGRSIVIVPDLDRISRGGGGVVFKTLAGMLDRFSPADRVALVPLGGGEPRVDFTNEFDRINEGLKRAVGRRGPPDTRGRVAVGIEEALAIADREDVQTLSKVIDRECVGFGKRLSESSPLPGTTCPGLIRDEARDIALNAHNETRQALNGLFTLIEALGKLSGPKVVVLLSEGFAYTQAEAAEFRRLGPAAARARVAIYSLALDDFAFDVSARKAAPEVGDDQALRSQSLDIVAGATRGTRFNVTATGAGVFDRLLTELSGYYLLSFEPAGDDRDGKSHRIGVKVSRSGVTVRAREAFVFTFEPAAAMPRDRIAAILREPLLVAELPLRVIAYSARGEGAKVKLILAAEIDQDATTPAQIAIGFRVADAKGKVAAETFEDASVLPLDAGRPSPRLHVTGAAVDPGRYTVKVAVVESSGRTASAEVPIEARLTAAAPLSTSDLMLGAVIAGRFRPRAELRRGSTLAAYLDVYAPDADAWEGVEITFEVAPRAGLPPLVSERAKLQTTPDARRRIALATVPIVLAAGNYYARAIVTRGGKPLGEVTRVLRIAP